MNYLCLAFVPSIFVALTAVTYKLTSFPWPRLPSPQPDIMFDTVACFGGASPSSLSAHTPDSHQILSRSKRGDQEDSAQRWRTRTSASCECLISSFWDDKLRCWT